MKFRRVIFPGILAISAGLGMSSACSAPDPGLLIFSENPAKIKPDSGITTLSDASIAADGSVSGPPSAFAGEPPYIQTSGASTDRPEHMARFGNANPAGHDCMTCHLPDATTPFVFGGTVFPPDGGDAGVPSAEVRVLSPSGTAMATYSNGEGNFYYLLSIGAPIEAGSLVGVRNGSFEQTMPDHLTGEGQAGCNQTGTCHGGTEGTIHLP
ncbi:MAG: hypothetical protein ABI183_23540 [Polyangiaceae bacterium]